MSDLVGEVGSDGFAAFVFLLSVAAGRRQFVANVGTLFAMARGLVRAKFDAVLEKLAEHEKIKIEPAAGGRTRFTILAKVPDGWTPQPLLAEQRFLIPNPPGAKRAETPDRRRAAATWPVAQQGRAAAGA